MVVDKRVGGFRVLRFLWATFSTRLSTLRERRAFARRGEILADFRIGRSTDASRVSPAKEMLRKREELRRLRYRLELDEALAVASQEFDTD